MTAILKVEDIHKHFGELEVLRGISFNMRKGESKVLIGPSGTGKSTLLRCINYLSPPRKGKIWLDGELVDSKADLNRVRSTMGFVFQDFNLFSHLTVHDNVNIGPMRVMGMNKKEASEVAMEKLRQVGLEDKIGAYPAQLSGGQQQRVSIARALAMEPKLLLFDEPTSALDPELIGEVLKVMIDLAKSGMTMLVVSHEMSFAKAVADEIIFLDGGKIIEAGPPSQIFSTPQHERTQKFLSIISEFHNIK